jgi:DNA-binding LytR/AlgR family response regulator
LLLDDEMPSLSYLKMLCEQIAEIEVVRAFDNSINFLDALKNLEFDICILDIEMPNINGLQIANLLNGKPVIFTTAYSEYAVDAFDLDAVDYLRKPLKLERLQKAVQKAIKRMKIGTLDSNYFQANTAKGKTIIYFNQLDFIRTSDLESRDKYAHLNNNSEILLKNISFEKLLKILPSDQFCRINKKEVLATRCVQYFSHDVIATNMNQSNGKKMIFHLSEIYRKDFIQKIKI